MYRWDWSENPRKVGLQSGQLTSGVDDDLTRDGNTLTMPSEGRRKGSGVNG